MLLVSACLVGINCKYNGGNNYVPEIADLVKQGKAVPLCPEQLGGLPTPRIPVEIKGGSAEDALKGTAVHTERCTDVNFKLHKRAIGSNRRFCKDNGIELAMLNQEALPAEKEVYMMVPFQAGLLMEMELLHIC